MVRGGKGRLRTAGMVLATCATAFAQSLASPERIPTLRTAFDSASGASQLGCQINAVRPALDYGLRFQTGYVIDIPMFQFEGAGHSLSTFIRVTPQGLKPAYLESTGALPEVPATRLDAEIAGSFVVGEGAYEVEALVQDDSHRVCHNKWRIQARRSGSERELTPATPAATVQEITAFSPDLPVHQSSPRIGRLTLMLHAAPLSSRASKLQDSDVSALVGSIFSLLQQLPAQSVRLVVFNLAQRAVLLRQDSFTANDLDKVITASNQLQLALVDYRTLQQHGGPTDLLAELVQTELRDPQPADALILLGPRLQMSDDIPVPAVDKPAAAPSLFYLQYHSQQRIVPGLAPMQGRGGRPGVVGDPGIPVDPVPSPQGPSDSIEKLFGRLKGKTIAIRTPHEFADALKHIDAGITSCGADPLVRGRPPGRSVRPCVETNVRDPKQDQGVPRGPGGTPHNTSTSSLEATAGNPTMPAEPKFTTPEEATGDVPPKPPKRPPRSVTDQSQEDGPLNLPTIDKQPQVDPSLDADPIEVLMRLRDKVLEHGARIPNHTCVETVQRDRYEPSTGRSNQSCDTLLARRKQSNFPLRLRLDTTDRLRLDVAMTPEREIYSWAGASKFEEGDIDQIVPDGAMGTGPFAAHLLSVFEKRNPKFVYEGDIALAGRSLMEYSYSVPIEESHYRVKAHKEWIVTGYTGTLLVDPKTSELVRLTVRTDELPPASGDCEVDTALEYGTVRLGGDDYLLPKVTRQRFIGHDGSEAENTITFSACREYQAESSVTFGGERGTPGAIQGSTPSAVPELPTGLPVTVELASTIYGDRAAAGDRIEGRLSKPIRNARQKTLVPEGSVVHGRLMRVETRHSAPPQLTVALRWESLEIDGVKLPVSLLPDRRPGNAGFTTVNALRRRGTVIELPLPGEGTYGVYHFRVEGVESGFRTEWLTGRP
jgi:hypothetical protein